MKNNRFLSVLLSNSWCLSAEDVSPSKIFWAFAFCNLSKSRESVWNEPGTLLIPIFRVFQDNSCELSNKLKHKHNQTVLEDLSQEKTVVSLSPFAPSERRTSVRAEKPAVWATGPAIKEKSIHCHQSEPQLSTPRYPSQWPQVSGTPSGVPRPNLRPPHHLSILRQLIQPLPTGQQDQPE